MSSLSEKLKVAGHGPATTCSPAVIAACGRNGCCRGCRAGGEHCDQCGVGGAHAAKEKSS